MILVCVLMNINNVRYIICSSLRRQFMKLSSTGCFSDFFLHALVSGALRFLSYHLYLFFRFADPNNWIISLFPLSKHYKKLIYRPTISIENWNTYYWDKRIYIIHMRVYTIQCGSPSTITTFLTLIVFCELGIHWRLNCLEYFL